MILLKKIGKKSDSNSEILEDFFFADFAENLLRWSSEKINFELFGTLELLVGKLEKNPIPSLKFGKF